MVVEVVRSVVQAPKLTTKEPDGPVDEYWMSRLLSLSLEMQFQVPTRLTLRFVMPTLGSNAPSFPFKIDTEVTVLLPDEFDGTGASFIQPCGALTVTEVGVEREGERYGEFVVVAYDGSYRMARSRRVTTYTNSSASTIVGAVAKTCGLSAGQIDDTGEQFPYVMQADTDFGFVSALARRYGFDWWVDGTTLHFTKPPANPTKIEVAVNEHLHRFSVSTSAVANKEVKVLGWDRDRKAVVEASARPSELPSTQIPGVSSAHSGGSGATALATAAVRTATQDEAQAVATSIVQSQMASAVNAQGEVAGNPAIVPGVVLKVVGEFMGGEYPVTQVEHRYTAAGYTTRFTSGDRIPGGLADLLGPSALPEHFGALTTLPPVVPAIVTKIGTGDDLGRVKVKFPFLSEQDESHWARVLSAGGGPDRGFWFLPEVDDEVLVTFEGGDTRFPVVLGGLYTKVELPENDLLDEGKIRSRSVRSRLGHYLDFIDGSDEQTKAIVMGLGDGKKPDQRYKLRIGEDRFDIEVPEKKPIAIKAGSVQITFTADKAIEVTGENVKIVAEKTLTLEGEDVKIKGGNTVGIEQGGNKISLGSGGLAVEGAPKASFKGGSTPGGTAIG